MRLVMTTLYHTQGAICMHCTIPSCDRQGVAIIKPGDVLHDTGRTGRTIPWHEHKQQAMALAAGLLDRHPEQAARMERCADRLTFRRDWSDPAQPGRLRLAQAHFCRVRLCPMCQWRRSLKMHGQLRQCIDYLDRQRAREGRRPYRYILLTLTVRNAAGPDLAAALDALQEGWQRLLRRAPVRKVVQGYVRAVEITYNRTRDDYHPHIHALLAVNPSYFTGRDYLPHATWRDLWQQSARLDYAPQVDARRASGGPDAIAEVAKYATKASDYLIPDDIDRMADVLDTLLTSCAKRRFAGWGGCLGDAHRALQLDDVEDGDLVHTGYDDAGESDAGAALWSWDWYVGPRLYISTEQGVIPHAYPATP
jgi:plasmid rolling circle replication initiator protein Rep